jgi:hypothetical protein
MRRFVFISLCSILLFCIAAPQARGYTLVQTNSGNNSGLGTLSIQVSFNNPNTTGNLIIVTAGWPNGGTASVTDSNGNSYATAVGPTTNGLISQIWYAANIVGGTNAVTVNFDTSYNDMVSIFEYSGIATSSPFDVTHSNTGSNSSLDTGSVTTTQANELIFASAYGNSSGPLTAGPNYSLVQYYVPSGEHLGAEHRNLSPTGSYDATFSDSGSSTWVAQIATFKPAVSSATPTCGIHGDTTNYIPTPTDWDSPPGAAKAEGGYYQALGGLVVLLRQ